QQGSLIVLQKQCAADYKTQDQKTILQNVLPDHTTRLSRNCCGRLVIQEVLQHGSGQQVARIARSIKGSLVALCMHKHGSQVVQTATLKAVQNACIEDRIDFLLEIGSSLYKCATNLNGNRVVQQFIVCLPGCGRIFLHFLKGRLKDLARHRYGSHVLQRCFEEFQQLPRAWLLSELADSLVDLMQDPYGNYLIQCMLSRGTQHERSFVASKLRGRMLQMSRHRFASNVCETALVTSDWQTRILLVEEMITALPDGRVPLQVMTKDRYAKYVVRTSLEVAEGRQKEEL
ncbi:ARM repeat-containing protein, partial [Artomyces pyxidatus]